LSTFAPFLVLLKNRGSLVIGVSFQKRNLPQRENFYVRHEGSTSAVCHSRRNPTKNDIGTSALPQQQKSKGYRF